VEVRTRFAVGVLVDGLDWGEEWGEDRDGCTELIPASQYADEFSAVAEDEHDFFCARFSTVSCLFVWLLDW
jgi:hypothetical protein